MKARSWKANSPTRATVSGRKGLDGIVVWQVGLRGNIDGAGCNDKKNDENRKERKHGDDADSIRRFDDSYECRMPMMRLLVPVTCPARRRLQDKFWSASFVQLITVNLINQCAAEQKARGRTRQRQLHVLAAMGSGLCVFCCCLLFLVGILRYSKI